MNKTYIEHVVIVLVLQALIYIATGNALASLAPIFLLIGREQAQSEYRYLSDRNYRRSDVKWLVFKSFKAWDTKSVLDWLLPTVAATILYGVVYANGSLPTL